jgi:hypothetical protein
VNATDDERMPEIVNCQAEIDYVCHAVTWSTGMPTLLMAAPTGQLEHLPIVGTDIGLMITSAERYCTGRYRFSGMYDVEPVACPHRAQVAGGSQCPACLGQDEFRFAHQAHQGGHPRPALDTYLGQPHWLYIATFARSVSKVGTAAAPRKASRLNEQGPLFATYIAQSPDGRAVRHLEDALSRELGLAQTVRRGTKIAALTEPGRIPTVVEHMNVVAKAVAALTDWGTVCNPHEWAPPTESLALMPPQPVQDRVIYPHDLRQGTHGFHIESCLGSTVLACLTANSDPTKYIVDLSVMKGRRVLTGDFTSPLTTSQSMLF